VRALLLSLILTGCITEVGPQPVPPGYAYCLDQRYWDPYCEHYYIWTRDSYTVDGRWVPGYWRVRPGYRPPIVRDHRR